MVLHLCVAGPKDKGDTAALAGVAAVLFWARGKTELLHCIGLMARAWAPSAWQPSFFFLFHFLTLVFLLICCLVCHCLIWLLQRGWGLPGPMPAAATPACTLPALSSGLSPGFKRQWKNGLQQLLVFTLFFYPLYFSVCLNKRGGLLTAVTDLGVEWRYVCSHFKEIAVCCTTTWLSISCHIGVFITLKWTQLNLKY